MIVAKVDNGDDKVELMVKVCAACCQKKMGNMGHGLVVSLHTEARWVVLN
jgi:hypothetical protein